MNEPLKSFAERLVRNGEVTQFLVGLREMGVNIEERASAAIRTYQNQCSHEHTHMELCNTLHPKMKDRCNECGKWL